METTKKGQRDMEVDDAVHMHIREISQFPLLSVQRTRRLARLMELRRALLGDIHAQDLIQQDNQLFARLMRRGLVDERVREQMLAHLKVARTLFICSNLRLVVKFARAYHRRAGETILLEELISEGDGGLMEAVDRFDWRQLTEQGEPIMFSTYARFWIDQRFSRYAAANRRAIRIPNHIQEHLTEIAKATRALRHTLNAEPTPEQIAVYITEARQQKGAEPVDGHWVANTLKINQQIAYLDEPVHGEEDMTLADIIPDHSSMPDEMVANASLREALHQVMLSGLDDQERMILGLRFGWFEGRAPMNLDAVGREIGKTRERVRQIEEHALDKLKASHRKRQLEDYHRE